MLPFFQAIYLQCSAKVKQKKQLLDNLSKIRYFSLNINWTRPMLCSSRLLCCYFCISCIYAFPKLWFQGINGEPKSNKSQLIGNKAWNTRFGNAFPSRYCISKMCTQRDWKFLKKYHIVFQECYENNWQRHLLFLLEFRLEFFKNSTAAFYWIWMKL